MRKPSRHCSSDVLILRLMPDRTSRQRLVHLSRPLPQTSSSVVNVYVRPGDAWTQVRAAVAIRPSWSSIHLVGFAEDRAEASRPLRSATPRLQVGDDAIDVDSLLAFAPELQLLTSPLGHGATLVIHCDDADQSDRMLPLAVAISRQWNVRCEVESSLPGRSPVGPKPVASARHTPTVRSRIEPLAPVALHVSDDAVRCSGGERYRSFAIAGESLSHRVCLFGTGSGRLVDTDYVASITLHADVELDEAVGLQWVDDRCPHQSRRLSWMIGSGADSIALAAALGIEAVLVRSRDQASAYLHVALPRAWVAAAGVDWIEHVRLRFGTRVLRGRVALNRWERMDQTRFDMAIGPVGGTIQPADLAPTAPAPAAASQSVSSSASDPHRAAAAAATPEPRWIRIDAAADATPSRVRRRVGSFGPAATVAANKTDAFPHERTTGLPRVPVSHRPFHPSR